MTNVDRLIWIARLGALPLFLITIFSLIIPSSKDDFWIFLAGSASTAILMAAFLTVWPPIESIRSILWSFGVGIFGNLILCDSMLVQLHASPPAYALVFGLNAVGYFSITGHYILLHRHNEMNSTVQSCTN